MSHAASQYTPHDEAPPANFSIMVVDDEENILGSLRRLIRPLGYTVQTATSAEQALDMLQRQPADLVISDMRMPGMDGATFLGEVSLRWPDTVRIILTGYADMETTIAAINKGTVFRYLRKPWEDAELTMIIEQALRYVELERERRRLQALTEHQNDELKTLNADLERRVEERTAELKQISEMLDVAYGDMQKEFLNVIPLVSRLANRREGLRKMAADQIAELAEALAADMHLSESLVQDIRLAALLHDIGKVALPDSVLGKPEEALTHQEFERYKDYPVIGAEVLQTVDPLKGAATIVHAQHEFFDGNGFPAGLLGDRIPHGARVLAVVRDYLALQTGGMKQEPLTKSQALVYLNQQVYKRYDPTVVKALERLLAAREAPKKVDVRTPPSDGGDRLIRAIAEQVPGAAGPVKSQARAGERALRVNELQDGMVLARDVCNREGKQILFRGFKLSAALIKKLVGYERNIGIHLEVFIRDDG